jgi:hypothetical protein
MMKDKYIIKEMKTNKKFGGFAKHLERELSRNEKN